MQLDPGFEDAGRLDGGRPVPGIRRFTSSGTSSPTCLDERSPFFLILSFLLAVTAA